MPVQTQMQVRRGTASSWTSTNPTLAAGELGFETDTGKFKIGNGSSTWTSLLYAGGGQSSLTTYQYTATAGQTTFSGADANSNTLSYTVGAIQVYLNGALLANTTDYAATNGTSVVLTGGAGLGDSLTIISFATFDVANTYTIAQADAAFIPDSIVTTKGDLIVATGSGTVIRQGVGANGTVLTANSAQADGVEWVTPSSGGMTLLSTTTLSGATVTISGIDQGYTRLVAFIFGVTNASGGGDFRIAPNGSTSNSTAVMTQNLSYVSSFQDTYWLLASSPTLTRTNAENAWTFVIDNYSSTTARKSAEHYGGYISASYGSSAGAAVGFINTTTAITSLVFSNTGGNLSTGTVLLYGVK
jgi:hypothetical protein